MLLGIDIVVFFMCKRLMVKWIGKWYDNFGRILKVVSVMWIMWWVNIWMSGVKIKYSKKFCIWWGFIVRLKCIYILD